MKRLFLVLLLILVVLATPTEVSAQQVCGTNYGGGVVCGIHVPVNTGLIDNPSVVGASFLLVSGTLLIISKKVKNFKI